MAVDQMYADALAEIEALKADRAWEARRANEAARLSAEARDQADHLRTQIADLQEQVADLERQRLDRDAWAVNLAMKHDLYSLPLPVAEHDEFGAIAAYIDMLRRDMTTEVEFGVSAVRVREEFARELERLAPVVEAAQAWRASVKAWGPPLRKVPGSIAGAEELIAAVDALDGATPCICNPEHRPDDPICQYRPDTFDGDDHG